MAHVQESDLYEAPCEAVLGPEEILDFSANVSPFPVPEVVRDALSQAAADLSHYPDPSAQGLRERAGRAFGVSHDEVLAGNGSTEFIYAIPRRIRPRRVVVLAPCYHDYWRAAEYGGGEPEGVLASEKNEFVPDMTEVETRLSGVDMAFIGNPNNPTGVAISAESIRALAGGFPSAVFVVDESFVEFVPEALGATLLSAALPPNVIVLRSLSPFHALPGLRLGFMIASREMCGQVDRVREPWTVSSLALRAGEALLDGAPDAMAQREAIIAERERVREALSRTAGLRVFRSQANFLLLKITSPGMTSSQLCERLLQKRILIHNAAGFRGLDSKFIRISIRSAEDNDRLLQTLQAALEQRG